MAGKNSRRRAVIVIAASVLVIACVAIAAVVLVQRAPKAGPTGSEAPSSSAPAPAGSPGSGTTETSGGYQVVSFPEGVFSASDEDEMRQVIEELGPALGITDAASQLDEPRVTEASGATTYRFPQRLNGIPVLDRSVVAATSGSEVVSVSGNTVAASSDVTEPSVGEDAVQASVEAALGEKYGEVQGVLLDSYDKGELVYYTFDVERPVLAWQVFASFSTESGPQGASLVVSAEDASVLRVTDGIQGVSLPGVEGEEDIPVDDWKGEDESVPLVSTVRGSGDDGVQVRVWEPANDAGLFDGKGKDQQKYYWWWKDSSGKRPYARQVMTGDNSTASKQGASAIVGLDRTVDFYADVLGRNSYDDEGSDITLFTNVTGYGSDGKNSKFNKNAAWWSGRDVMLISRDGYGPNGENIMASNTEVMGHEFTHGVISHCTSLLEGDEANALNEALSDVMGLCVLAYEQSEEGDYRQVDWKLDCLYRNVANPSEFEGQLTTYQDFLDVLKENGGVEEHSGSTVISHTFYLIWQDWTKYGDPTDLEYMDLLAKLTYQTILLLPANASFSQLSQSAQEAGRIMVAAGELSQSQADAIARSFAAQGIEAGRDTTITYCTSDVDLTVTDINGHAYGNYSIGFSAAGVTKVPAPQDVVVGPEGASGKIPLRLRATDFDANAVYEVTVADLGGSGADPVTVRLIFSPSAALSGEEAADMRIPTAFGTRDVVPASVPRTNVKPDVTLVLDVSGSMDGAPMDSLRGAVSTFLDTAEKADLTVGIVSFSNDAKAVSSLGKDYAAHRAAIFSDDFDSGGGTNVEAGLNGAEQLLGGSSASSKAVVLMTDGIANDGATGDDLVSVAADLKSKGISLYTLGFFNSLSGSELSDAQTLLERMATQGEHFEATGSSLEDFFAAIASQLQGDRYTYIRVACPVDVTVVHEGQVLSSAAGGVASVSDFGSVTTMASGSDDGAGEAGDSGDPIKIVRLLQGQDYEIYLTGTGEGTMDYSVSYMDETGAYVDERSFEDVPVSAGSLMQTSSSQAPETTLDVDSDGDGTTDLRLSAASGEAAHTMTREEFSQRRAAVVVGALVVLTALVAVLEWRARARRVA